MSASSVTIRTFTREDIPFGMELKNLAGWNQLPDDWERFVAWEKWLATAPIAREESSPAIPEDARLVSALCGKTRVWLARDGDRWLMYAGSRQSRRRDFASPYLAHAVRTAEAWYGPAASGWQVEHRR